MSNPSSPSEVVTAWTPTASKEEKTVMIEVSPAESRSLSPTTPGGRQQPRAAPRGSTEALLAKVNRAHKGLVRKEVWRQKFDFLYRQVEAEVKYDKDNPSHSSSAYAGNLATSSANL